MNSLDATPVSTESSFTKVSGQRIEYRQFLAQDPTAPTLVFLHQGLGSVSAWRNVPLDLAQRTGCSAFWYSRPGYGWSEPPRSAREPDYMQIEASQILPEVLNAFGLTDIILIGHSDGGTIALSYLGSGGHARAVIAIAPHVCDEQVTHETIAVQRADWYTGPLRGRLQRHHENADDMFLSWTDIWLSPRFRNWSMKHLLPYVTVPALGLQGEQDETGSMLHINMMAQLINAPVELQKFANCGHDPFREYPERALSACADFLRRHARTPR